MDNRLVERLRHLGVNRGAGHLKPTPHRRGKGIEELLPGEVVYNSHGAFFLYRETHGLDYCHGNHALADLLGQSRQASAWLARDERLARVDPDRIAFVDTETTGLAGGSGTCTFLVGVGVFEGDAFVVHQFFMRDYGEEPAQIEALGDLLDRMEAVVSFNGKSFDLPLLETRFIMNRQPPRLTGAPHLDLLVPARRIWKHRLNSCALSSLEGNVLGVRRTQADVPGWLIPELYVEYTRTGDACNLPGVFYHNAQDILSLVTLAARLCTLLTSDEQLAGGMLPGEDLYGLGGLLLDLGQSARAEQVYSQAARACSLPSVRELAMRDLAYLLKRQERRAEALPWWQQLAETAEAVYACEELAKHYEWHDQDLAHAAAWTRRAIALVEGSASDLGRRENLAELQHRLARLARKIDGLTGGWAGDER
ncbi:MAG: ribonuclease H-like domain-containing protein [Anaerolineae bacterium]|nr:ribonuclease H-like domain-containing protein [Anaerolineae bacterium]